VLRLLEAQGCCPLAKKRILEIGCGTGHWLRALIQWGARPENLVGIDLLDERIGEARRLCPQGVELRRANAAALEFPDGTFDIVLQATVFTSILDADLKRQVAREMLRVLKPEGIILWYDFHMDNPRNPNVRGVKRAEIGGLFTGCCVALKRTTLAPPLARVLAKYSWLACWVLEKMPFLCTHYLGVIRKPAPGASPKETVLPSLFENRDSPQESNPDACPPSPGIRAAAATDIPAIARIHKQRFATHLLGQYSTSLIGQYYAAFLDRAVFLVHEGEAGVDGFVVGGPWATCWACKRAFLRANVPRCLGEALCHPRFALAALRQARHMLGGARTRRKPATPAFRLLSIAVAEEAGGTGVGADLVKAFEARIPPRVPAYGLSVHTDNARAIRFYRKLGLELIPAAGPSACHRFVKRLDRDADGAALPSAADANLLHQPRKCA